MANPKGYKVKATDTKTTVVLYDTSIVIDDGVCVTLNSGGFRTRHTLKCLNLYLERYSMSVTQKKGEWLVTHRNGATIPFRDGLTISH